MTGGFILDVKSARKIEKLRKQKGVCDSLRGTIIQPFPTGPLVAMDYGFLGRDTDVDLATILVLIQRLHGAVGACRVLHKGPEPSAIDCVLAYFDTWGLREVLLKADIEPAIQALVDAVRAEVFASVKWCVRECSAEDRELHENLRVCVLQEKSGCKVDSKSIVLPLLVRHGAYVLSRFVRWSQYAGPSGGQGM